MLVSLQGISKRGKQLVTQYGAEWRVLAKREHVQFSQIVGNWLYVVPAGDPDLSERSRWVNSLNDEDFKVMPFA